MVEYTKWKLMPFSFSLKSELKFLVENVCRFIYTLQPPKLTEEAGCQSLQLCKYIFFHMVAEIY